ncbi:hypothetical protein FACS1894214_0180 [Planctomycetales bacterium]|nr:hypothetical protein FACS1894214_0180 [Planctomycetales bacterium]
MPAFNRTFFDLNEERQYVLAESSDKFPSSVIADLKLSVPGKDPVVSIAGVLINENVVRVVIIADNQLVAGYASDTKYSLKKHRVYPLKSYKEGYEGVLSFGNGLSQNVSIKGDFPISEECLTRFKPSAIPYISIPCTNVKLTGQVLFGGDTINSISTVENIPADSTSLFDGLKQSLVLDLIDTGFPNTNNPIVRFANGINGYNDLDDQKSPVYSIHGVLPNAEGTLFVHFADHFHIAGIVSNQVETVSTSQIAVGSDITMEHVCGPKDEEDGSGGGETDNCPITFVKVEYA